MKDRNVATIEAQINTLSEAELDSLPVGVIQLNRSGKILYYNRSQAELARRNAGATVGLNFFEDVAPCAAVKAFQGRFHEFVENHDEKVVEPFDFVFDFPWGTRKVTITMVRSTRGPESFYVIVVFSDVATQLRS
jgi:photoactive yellow protein